MITNTNNEIFCPHEQNCLKCFKYITSDDTVFTFIQRNAGGQLHFYSNHNRVLFMVEGKGNLLCNNNLNKIESGSMILIPHKSDYSITVTEDSFMVIVNLHPRFNFCEHFSLQNLYHHRKQPQLSTDFYPLQNHVAITLFLQNIIMQISAGMKCKYFHEMKQQELFFYFRSYYSENELFNFFSPILNDDTNFAEVIYQNYESVKTLNDLANITHYSVSGFKKRFQKVFGMSPQLWIRKEKAKKIYKEIINTHKPFKEISIQYHFCSISHFNRFCKQMYGISPAKLRR